MMVMSPTWSGAAVSFAGFHKSERNPFTTLLTVSGRVALPGRGGGGGKLGARKGKGELGREGGRERMKVGKSTSKQTLCLAGSLR